MTLEAYLIRLLTLCALPFVVLLACLSGFAILDQARHEASDATELAVDTATRLDHFFDVQLRVLRANVTRLGEGPGSGERWKELTQHWTELAGAQMFLVATSDGTGVKIVPLDGTGLSEAAAANFRIEALDGLVSDALKAGAALSEGLIDAGSSQQFVAAAVSAGKDRVLVVATPRFTLEAYLASPRREEEWTVAVGGPGGTVAALRSARPGHQLFGYREFNASMRGGEFMVRVRVPLGGLLARLAVYLGLLCLGLIGLVLGVRYAAARAGRRLALSLAGLAAPAEGTPPKQDGPISSVSDFDRIGAEVLELRREKDDAYAALGRAEQRYQSLVDRSLDGVLMISDRGVIASGNRAAARLLGFEAFEFAGLTRDSLVDGADQHSSAAWSVLWGTSGGQCEVFLRRKDGSRLYAEVFSSAFLNGAGEAMHAVVFRDSTRRAEAQQARVESESKLQLFFEHAPAALAMFDRDLRCVAVSRRWAEDYRIAAADAVGRAYDEIFPAAGNDAKRAHEKALSGETVRREADLVSGGDAIERWLRWEVRPWWQSDGSVGGTVTLSEDITSRVRAERDLLESESRFRTIFENSAVAIVIRDCDTGQCLDANPLALALHGVSTVAKLDQDSFGPETPYGPADMKAQCRLAATQGPRVFEWKGRHVSGREVWLEVHLRTIVLSGTQRILSVAMDITERRRVADELHKLSRALEQCAESIVVTDPQGDIEYVNEAFMRTFDLRGGGIIGRSIDVMKAQRSSDSEWSDLRRAMAQQRIWRGEYFSRSIGGRDIVVAATFAPIRDSAGKVTHYVSVHEDITERKIIVEELGRHRHRLEEMVEVRTAELAEAKAAADDANLAKSVFLANMSHEIRTPMNAILGFAHLLQEEGGLGARQRERLQRISQAGEHLLGIINDVLDLSKIEAGKLALEETDFSLRTLIESVQSLVAGTASAKGLEVVTDCDGVPDALRGDPTRLRQALLNYVGNAVKFTAAGRVSINVRMEEHREQEFFVRFEVADTGIGVPADKQHLLFSAFQQADSSTTRRYGGTGLGLVVVQGIATAMGGASGFSSEEGKGSTFWFTARLKAGRATSPATREVDVRDAEESIRESFAGSRILLAEDDPINQELAVALISSAGLRVDVVDNGREAVAMAQSGAYALVLMDMQMPVMNGLDATRSLRSQPGMKSLPVIAMTANAFEDDRQRCFAAGINDFIGKPVDPATMFRTLLKWLRSSSARQPEAAPVPVLEAANDRLTASAAAAPISFPAALSRIRPERLREIARKYVSTASSDIVTLSEAIRSKDSDQVRATCHRLKSPARWLGAVELGDALESLERWPCALDPVGARRVLEHASALVQRLGAGIDVADSSAPRDVDRPCESGA